MNFAWMPIEPATTLMMFWVRVPVLSVQMMEALASLTGTEDTNEEILGSHSFSSESEGEGCGKRETFWNSDDNQCDGNDQDLREGNPLLAGSATRRKKLE